MQVVYGARYAFKRLYRVGHTRHRGMNQLCRDELVPDERDGGLQRNSPERATIRTQSLRPFQDVDGPVLAPLAATGD